MCQMRLQSHDVTHTNRVERTKAVIVAKNDFQHFIFLIHKLRCKNSSYVFNL